MRLKLAAELPATLAVVSATADADADAMRPTRLLRRFIATTERANLQGPRKTALAALAAGPRWS